MSKILGLSSFQGRGRHVLSMHGAPGVKSGAFTHVIRGLGFTYRVIFSDGDKQRREPLLYLQP